MDSIGTDLSIRISDLEASLRDKADELKEKKVDKAALGELFIKLGTSIKGK